MKFLLFGSEGQLGRELALEIEKKGYNLIKLSHKELDITDEKKVKEVILDYSPDFTINATAYNNVDQAEIESQKAFAVNAEAVRNMAIWVHKTHGILVHFSTDYVFDGEKGAPYTTNDEPNPINTYGKSKLQGELYIKEILNRYFIIRVSWVFGFGKTNFPLKLLEWAKDNKILRVAEDQFNAPTYTVDCAKYVMELILKGKFGLYHLTNSGYCSRYEWAKLILNEWGYEGEILPAKTEDFPSLAKRPKFTVLDCSKFESETGLRMPPWQDAVKRFIQELKRRNAF
ncbi:MAG: dTDP-4-dehydrorhamnose reductase [candidate division WOR-3 bacterium]